MHVLHTFANNSSVPYLSWFAERAHSEGNIRYTFIILYPERPAMIDEMKALGFPCHWIKYDDNNRKRGMLNALPQMWNLLRKIRPDVLHCNLFDDSLPGMVAGWLAGIKVRVVTKQDTGYHWLHTPKWMRFDRLITRLSTDVITISNESKMFLLAKEGAPEQKLRLVHNGIPPERFTQQSPTVMEDLRKRFRINEHRPVIGTVARFIPWKGYGHIVEAVRLLTRKHPDAIFLFCGTGKEEAQIKKQVQAANLQEQVVFTGWVDRAEMASFYGLMDVYLHAAVLEPFGLVYAEAMMNGVPVVSTRTGAALDAIEDGQNGILVEERSGEALADGIERLLQLDTRTVGQAGKRTALRMFPFEVMWKGTTEVYRQALAREK
ncbi:MAG: glycosyltransferase family 4 protein [Flavobacteriales bacterium]|jgi:glycosyltransferase involved in cell wall biosynthesis|nr:glycosyltransferase [Flavobacteriales bacterium]